MNIQGLIGWILAILGILFLVLSTTVEGREPFLFFAGVLAFSMGGAMVFVPAGGGDG